MENFLAATAESPADNFLKGVGEFLADNPLFTLILLIVLFCLIKFR